MAIPCYLALTAGEFAKSEQIPENCAYMACHFSCYGTGLSNLPETLPSGALIIFNDRTPAYRHDPKQILNEMQMLVAEYTPSGVLLDFQRPDVSMTKEVTQALVEGLSCPVAVTLPYAQNFSCPIFLPPPPLHMPLKEYLAPYDGREIWLELATETMRYIINKEGCVIREMEYTPLPQPIFTEESAFCRYHIEVTENQAEFTLQRTERELTDILSSDCSIARCVGLYQQLKNMPVS